MVEKSSMLFSARRKAAMDSDEEEREIYNHRNVTVSKQDFEEVESTSEYRETNYYKVTEEYSNRLVTLNQYWCDYAKHLISGKGAFLSSNFTENSENERSSFFVLCTLDL